MAVGLVGWLVLAPAAQSAVDEGALELELGPGVEVRNQAATGKVGFVGTEAGGPIEAAIDGGARARALGFAGSIAPELGISDPERDLTVVDAERFNGRATVRLQQLRAGVPVIGGELVVNLDPRGDVLSLGGETVPARFGVGTEPTIAAGAAAETAVAAVAREYDLHKRTLSAAEGELSIYDSRLLGGPGLERPQLVWRFEVDSSERLDLRQLVLVDAELGGVTLSFNQIAAALDRDVCDAANADAEVPCGSPVREEGDPAVADSGGTVAGDVDAAYDFSGDTYELYAALGREGIADDGAPTVSTVDYCGPDESCPLENAFWNGSQMVYGDGYAGADDVVGHELTHGVTEATSRLFYYYQSGAINESISDVFGELVDLANGTDAPADRWLIGEDKPIGAIRDMAEPSVFGDPDRMTSGDYFSGEDDNGGVHSNSGVSNKAAYLITDGDSFNGQTVAGLGEAKAAAIYYELNRALLTSASDYQDLASALPQACTNLIGSAGIVAGDCEQAAAAVTATEMATNPPAAPTPPPAGRCGPGEGPATTTAFFDDLEAGPGNWEVAGDPTWFYASGGPGTYASSGVSNLHGTDPDALNSSRAQMTAAAGVTVPENGYLRFSHAHGFEHFETDYYDGGLVAYSTNGGSTWFEAGPLFVDNGPTGTISSDFDNPLAGLPAFVADSRGYFSSRVDLGSLAGEEIRIGFHVGADSIIGDAGWFVDDIEIYGCERQVSPPPVEVPGPVPSPSPDPVPVPVPEADTAVLDPSLRTKKKQKQRGKRVVVAAEVGAGEAVEVGLSGKVKVGGRSYPLKALSRDLGSGESRKLKLKPTKNKNLRKIRKALKRGKKVTAALTATYTDAAGNSAREKGSVKLIG